MTPEDQDVYRQIAAGLDVPHGHDMSRLLSARLVEPDPSYPDRYNALDPYAAVQALVNTEEAALQRSRQRIALIPTLQALSTFFQPQRMYVDGSEVLPFGELMNARIGQAMTGATAEVYSAQPGRPVDRDPEVQRVGQERVLAALGRGVKYRGLYQAAALTHEPTVAYVNRVLDAGGDIRIHDGEFPRLIVVDSEHLFIDNRLTPDAERNSGGYVTDRLVVTWGQAIFDIFWDRATRWRDATGQSGVRTSPIQRAILRGLSDGAAVHEVGDRVGLKERSVQKHLSALRDSLGFRTRDQVMVWWGRSEEQHLP